MRNALYAKLDSLSSRQCASPLSTTTTKSTSDYDDDELQLKFGMRPKDENKSKLHQLIIDKDKEIASKIYVISYFNIRNYLY